MTPSDILYNVIGVGGVVNMGGTFENDGTLIAIDRDINCAPCLAPRVDEPDRPAPP